MSLFLIGVYVAAGLATGRVVVGHLAQEESRPLDGEARMLLATMGTACALLWPIVASVLLVGFALGVWKRDL